MSISKKIGFLAAGTVGGALAIWLILNSSGINDATKIQAFVSIITVPLLMYTLVLQFTQFENQQKEFSKQNFETNVFNLFNIHNSLIKDIVVGQNIGKKYIEGFYNSFNNVLDVRPRTFEGCKERYANSYLTFRPILDPYFQSLRNILHYIFSAKVSSDQRRFFLSVLQAQLTHQEKVALYYHAVFGEDKQLTKLYKLAQFHKGFHPMDLSSQKDIQFIDQVR